MYRHNSSTLLSSFNQNYSKVTVSGGSCIHQSGYFLCHYQHSAPLTAFSSREDDGIIPNENHSDHTSTSSTASSSVGGERKKKSMPDAISQSQKSSKLFYQVWTPYDLSRVVGVVLLVHGLNEHSGRYKQLVDQLVSHRYAVFALDLEGHGRSDGKRAFIDNFQMYIHNGLQFLDFITSGTLHLHTCDEEGHLYIMPQSLSTSTFIGSEENGRLSVASNSSSYSSSNASPTKFRKSRNLGSAKKLVGLHSSNVSLVEEDILEENKKHYSPKIMKSIMDMILGVYDREWKQHDDEEDMEEKLNDSFTSSSSSTTTTPFGNYEIGNIISQHYEGAWFEKNSQLIQRPSEALLTVNQCKKPIFLFGQGIGGLVSLFMSMEREKTFAGMVLSAPMVTVPSELHSFLQKIAKGIAACVPNMPIMEMDLKKRTHSQEEIENFKKDPYTCKDKLKAKLCFQILDTTKFFKEECVHKLETPFIVFQGTCDEYCSPEGAQFLMEKSTRVKDKELVTLAGLYHDLLFEVCAENTLLKIMEWVNKRNPLARSNSWR